MNEKNFKFKLNEYVRLSCSNEGGDIIGRAQYAHSENSYLIRYRGADQRATEAWWGESALARESALA